MKKKLGLVCLGAAALLIAAFPVAAVQPVTVTLPLNLGSDPCNGDNDASGNVTLSIQTSTTLSSDGTIAHVKLMEDIHGTMFSPTSGITYQVSAHESEQENVNLVGNTGEETIYIHIVVAAQGGNGNLSETLAEHITVNADGTVTVDNIKGTGDIVCH